MSTVLKGKPTADALDLDTSKRVETLKAKGVTPTLAILRVGEREDDLAYERGALKRAEKNGVAVKQVLLPADVTQDELLAKVTSLLRRYKEYRGKPDAALAIENLEVDFAARTVVSNGQPVSLTDTEFSILEHLLRNRGTTVTAPELYEGVWKEKFLPGSGNTVMVHVLNLRRKIEENPSSPKIIRTVWGKGYQID